MPIRPLHDRLIVKADEEKEVSDGGIIIPDMAKEKPVEGTVISAGKGRMTDEGELVPMEVKAGDRILFSRYAGSEIKVNDEPFLIMREEDVLGVLE